MRSSKAAPLAVLFAAVLLVGCGEKEDTVTAPGSTGAEEAPEAPRSEVSFVTPKDGATVKGALVGKVKLKNFVIDPKAVGKSNQPGRGHLHFQLDEGKFDVPKYSGPNGRMAVKLGVEGTYSPAVETNITYRNLPRGKHMLEVYLANNNHTNLGPEADVEVVVK